LHIASPFVVKVPKDENELIKPAVDGTLRALKAAKNAGVKRVVLTSSTVAMHGGKEGLIKINQDSNIFVTEIDPNISLNLEIQNDRQGYLLCIEGDNNIIKGKDNQINLSRHDAAEVIGPQTLSITTSNNKSHFLLVEMKYELGSGRKDL
jgi:redox-sensitive bicupin YhaK (pirin superfamily)